MRYHYEKPTLYSSRYGSIYNCDHSVYNKCTLFKINSRGLVVIQQRYNKSDKTTYWDKIDPWLVDELYLHTKFEEFFNKRATVTVKQIMWGFKMKLLRRERWETCFDRRLI